MQILVRKLIHAHETDKHYTAVSLKTV